MPARRSLIAFLSVFCILSLLGFAMWAQQPAAGQYPSSLLAGLQWRDVGPMRAGRSYAVAGVPEEPDTFYFGSVGGESAHDLLARAAELAAEMHSLEEVVLVLFGLARNPSRHRRLFGSECQE